MQLSRFLLLLGATLVTSPDVTFADEPVRERVRVDVVRIPLRAQDSSGVPVEHLSSSELMLRVDGQPVTIETLDSDALPTPAPLYAEQAAPRASKIPSMSLETLILIDESTANVLQRRDAIEELVRFLSQIAGVRRVLVSVFRHGRLQVTCPWTPGLEKVRSALGELRRHPTIEPDPTFIATARSAVAELEALRGRLLMALLEALAAFPDHVARRQLILITGGTTLAPRTSMSSLVEAGRDANGPFGGAVGARGAGASIEESRQGFQLWSATASGQRDAIGNAELVAKAVERDVALIAVDTSAGESLVDMSKKTLGDTRTRPVLSSELEVAQTLKALTDETGGEFIAHPWSWARKLAQNEARQAAAITFRDPFPGDHRLHRITLTCQRPGVQFSYRRAYRIPKDEDRIFDSVVGHFLDAGVTQHDLGLTASATAIATAEGRHLTRVQLRYAPPHASTDAEERPVELLAIGRDAEGAWTAPIRWLGSAHAVEGSFAAVLDLGVARGTYTWSLAVRDTPTALVDYVVVGPPKARP